MKYTFEITVAGCNARCRHCYVSGGPGSSMPLSDYRACLEKLVPALTRLKGSVSIAPGHEPFNHEEAAALMRMTHALAPQFYPHILHIFVKRRKRTRPAQNGAGIPAFKNNRQNSLPVIL